MASAANSIVVLDPVENERLANLCGQFDEHIRLLERRLGVDINQRGNEFTLVGGKRAVELADHIVRNLYDLTGQKSLVSADVHLQLQESELDSITEDGDIEEVTVRTKRAIIKARGSNQRAYIQNIRQHDISFGIGPAGTGKTYLAVACAVGALESEQVRRL